MDLTPDQPSHQSLEQSSPLMTPTKAWSRSSKKSSPKFYDLSPEAHEFVEDLRNYLPLGCVSFEHTIIDEGGEDRPITTTDVSQRLLCSPPAGSNSDADTDALRSSIRSLTAAHWIRVEPHPVYTGKKTCHILRIYILPADVGVRHVERNGFQSKKLYAALETLLLAMDTDPEVWEGTKNLNADLKAWTGTTQRSYPATARGFDMWATAEDGSLYYIFNTLTSPAPSINEIPKENTYTREALEDLLDPASTPGLKTILMPYQRRSAGLMLQREAAPKSQLDPRLEERTAPDGSIFYYNPRDLLILRHPVYLEACRGGILAETMGLGKTVMLLALILATKHHLPALPEGHIALGRSTGRIGAPTLSQMAVSAINRKSVPWQVELERVKHATGDDIGMGHIAEALNASSVQYEVVTAPARWNRKTMLPAPKKMILAATTIVVVPQNLCKQWKSEIDKHVESGSLRVLVMETKKDILPPPDELRTYDVVLFSRNRFDTEARDGQDNLGRIENQRLCRCPYIGATRTRDCTCVRVEDLYDSPLKHLHFKRLIVDEGHFFSNSGSNAVLVASKLVTADHRWVVSGTPAKNLLGVEVDVSATETSRDAMLHQRRKFGIEDKDGAIKNIASLAQHFLRVRPWASSPNERVEWDEYVFRHETLRGKSYSGFSSCLRRTLESLIIKTQPADVERDLTLPPLHHEVVYLEPSFYDKLTANIFTIMLIANAVASERTDADYLFHRNSGKARHELVSNLRQSAFFWTGFSGADVLAMIKNSETYLGKDGAHCSPADRRLLTTAMDFARRLLMVDGWKAMEKSHELGIFVEKWPGHSAQHWAFDRSYTGNLMTGISPLLEAQKHVNSRTMLEDCGEGLAGAGVRALAEENTSKVEQIVKGSSRKTSSASRTKKRKLQDLEAEPRADHRQEQMLTSLPELPSQSRYLQTRVVGTASTKLSYLITQVLRFHVDEKIIIFYDGKNVAYYIAQMLELLHIKHEIYDSSLPAKLKSEYVVRFDQEPQDRVLLMDVKQAAFGLNLSSASRIFFVNPVCRPDVEAQAIKRAHRIGQIRKVHVETLVLKGTIEQSMLERSQRMTRSEHAEANKLEDDGGIREIIQNAQLLPLDMDEPRMARLNEPQQLWGRDGWRDFIKAAEIVRPGVASPAGEGIAEVKNHQAMDENSSGTVQPTHSRTVEPKTKKVVFVDRTNHHDKERYIIEEESVEGSRLKKRVRVAFSLDGPSVAADLEHETNDDEPLRKRWLRQPSPITPMRQGTPVASLFGEQRCNENTPSPEQCEMIREIVRKL